MKVWNIIIFFYRLLLKVCFFKKKTGTGQKKYKINFSKDRWKNQETQFLFWSFVASHVVKNNVFATSNNNFTHNLCNCLFAKWKRELVLSCLAYYSHILQYMNKITLSKNDQKQLFWEQLFLRQSFRNVDCFFFIYKANTLKGFRSLN